MPGVFEDEEDCDLIGHLGPRRERSIGVHAEIFAHWMEEPDLGKFHGEMR
jgi:hypothetical protein